MSLRPALTLILVASAAALALWALPSARAQVRCKPVAEMCNALDDDCDGRVDEDFRLDARCTTTGAQCPRPGRTVCNDSGSGVVCWPDTPEGGQEICNGADDDCDGLTDEGFKLGRSCAAGRGACRAEGLSRCSPDGRGVVCGAIEGVPGEELCGNRIDDDCDGRVDEGFRFGAACKVGVGACLARGKASCGPDGRVECSARPKEPGEELCGNRIDDDCDGEVDEGFDTGSPCSSGLGACAGDGALVCSPDRRGTACRAKRGPKPELCGNGVDEDCDGEVDEGFGIGEPCQAGRGACMSYGTLTCAQNGRKAVCDARAGKPTRELCGNGVDDDCDGNVDEGYKVGAACAAGRGACRNEGQFTCAPNGLSTSCDAVAGIAGSELCGNKRDDDCDGRTDEGFDAGRGCSAGIGACRVQGKRVCSGDGTSTVCAAQPAAPGVELCGNRKDDDCDGEVDEGFELGGACEVGIGVCAKKGRMVCAKGGDGTVCSASPAKPGPELCGNERDDDCDGQVDEGFDVGAACTAGAGACLGTGEKVCARDRKTTTCAAKVGKGSREICGNHIDDDCDGEVDEGFRLGDACSVGVGACAGTGVMACSEDGRKAICDAWKGRPSVELCGNGVDDDCDGKVDEGFDVGARCHDGLGVCRAVGKRVCSPGGGSTLCDAQPGPPGEELCGNRRDDDCDGDVDEGYELGAACGVGTGACARKGRQACAPDGRSTVCSATAGAAVAELCGNKLDDDCDGEVDEGFALGGGCVVGKGACAVRGAFACGRGGKGVSCVGRPKRPGAELCGNGIDDDCDGETDEGFELGSDCSTGVGGCARRGVISCSEDGRRAVCGAAAGEISAELCGNGIDDDCDGKVDEGFDVGKACVSGQGACRSPGKRVCGANGLSTVCDATPRPPGAELCGTRVDEDCDGEVDEGFDTGRECAVGTGSCRRKGRFSCSPDARSAVCAAQPGKPGAELCGNRVDDDCDGEVDEGFDLGGTCTAGAGACQARGVNVCSPDGKGVICGARVGRAQKELCGNGVDDDCDGEVDEGFEVGGACRMGRGACLVTGVTRCSPDGHHTLCDATPGDAGAELCGNRVDDDCDGEVDEGFRLGLACTSGGKGACRAEGKTVCSATGLKVVCDAAGLEAAKELCGNGIDDDCDGKVDEGFEVGRACKAGLGVCARKGKRICSPDGRAAICGVTPGPPGEELCGTRLDEDCDGEVDEGFAVGASCAAGTGICAREGRLICSEDKTAVLCGAKPGTPREELCGDGEDNDCDGEVDEGFSDDDGDGFGCDNCPDVPNLAQGDLDGDDQGDACDPDTLDVYVPDSGPVSIGSKAGAGLDSDLPLRQERVPGFYIEKTEVTNRRYARCVDAAVCTPPGSAGSRTRDSYFEDSAFADHPVVNVTWWQSKIFCEWDGKRLPTEVEWEKAAGAGAKDGRPLPWGGQALDLYPFAAEAKCARANHFAGAECDGGDTSPVGSHAAGTSPYGLRDVSGNVWEWTASTFTGEQRVIRGGSYRSKVLSIRVRHREGRDPAEPSNHLGFRCAL